MSLLLLLVPTGPNYVIINNANTRITYLGSGEFNVEKIAGADAYDADAVSVSPISRNFVLRIRPKNTAMALFAGVDASPTGSSSYTTIDRALFFDDVGNVSPSENGSIGSVIETYNTTDYWFIRRVGTTVTALSGTSTDVQLATLKYTFTALSGDLYFDSSLKVNTNVGPTFGVDVNFSDVVPLDGQSVTAAQGSTSAAVSVALTGQAITVARGTVLQGAPIDGHAVTAAQGSSTPGVAIALTGQSVTAARGSVTAAASLDITGQAVVAAQGSVVAAPTSALSGQGIIAAQGSVLADSSIGLTGQSATVVGGSLLATTTLALTGGGVATDQGSLAPAFSAALSGQSLIAEQGTAVPANGVTLSGVSALIARGTIGPQTIAVLVGGELTLVSGTLTSNIITPTSPQTAKATRRLRESQRRYTDKWGVWR